MSPSNKIKVQLDGGEWPGISFTVSRSFPPTGNWGIHQTAKDLQTECKNNCIILLGMGLSSMPQIAV